MASKKDRMAGLSLSDFAGNQPTEPETKKPKKAKKQTEETITMNIKIQESQHEWLTKTARKVRNNNDEPVPAKKRVFPQHLINVAIDLLQGADIDWEGVQNEDDIREKLDL